MQGIQLCVFIPVELRHEHLKFGEVRVKLFLALLEVGSFLAVCQRVLEMEIGIQEVCCLLCFDWMWAERLHCGGGRRDVDAWTSLLHGGRITYLGDPVELSFGGCVIDRGSGSASRGERDWFVVCFLSFESPSLLLEDHRHEHSANPRYIISTSSSTSSCLIPHHREPLYDVNQQHERVGFRVFTVAAEKDQLVRLRARCCRLRSSNEINPAPNPIASPNHDERT